MDTPHQHSENNGTIPGIVHGDAVHLPSNHGLIEGQPVEVVVVPAVPQERWGEGLRRCAGALSDEATSADDEYLEEIQQSRRS